MSESASGASGRRIQASTLEDGKVVWGLKLGDVIVREDDTAVDHIHVIDGGFVVHSFKHFTTHAEIFVAPVMTIERHFLSLDTIAQAAAWLAERAATTEDTP